MLPYQDIPYYTPYDSYHVSETLQILAFTALGFMLFKGRIGARATINLDLDWFYRQGGKLFLWLAENPIQWLDTVWGKAYRVVGLYSLTTTARFWAWFDWHGIDGLLDGSARSVRSLGRRLSQIMQRGNIQMTICYSVSFVALIMIAFIWL
jgi:multicomponent Na+:H+ antiporter subunit D